MLQYCCCCCEGGDCCCMNECYNIVVVVKVATAVVWTSATILLLLWRWRLLLYERVLQYCCCCEGGDCCCMNECYNIVPIYVIYSNTLVHSSPHLPVYCMGRWVRLHCFFSNGNIRYDTTFDALDIDRQFTFYFTSYCIESRHLCEQIFTMF